MLSRATRTVVFAAACLIVLGRTPASAQPLGSFTWQMQPYCNVVTVMVTRSGGNYTAFGYDDQCGAARRGGVVGMGVVNPDGTIGIDFTIVTTPGGKGVHVAAVISPGSGHGTWVDSVGNSGAFILGQPPGAALGGPPRPTSPSGLSPGAVGRTELAPAAVGASQIDTTQVQARVTGTCAADESLRGVAADGSVMCQAAPVRGGGSFTRTTFSFASVSPAGQPPDTLTALTFTAPLSGKAILRARGTCNMVPQSGIENAVNIVPTLGVPGLAFVAFDLGNWAIVRVPAGDASAGNYQVAWTAERVEDVTTGQTYTASLMGQHEAGASATNCHGSLTVVFHDAELP